MICPHCECPEFTPVRRVTRVRDGIAARLLTALLGRPLLVKTGDIVCCARCTYQYVVSRAGVYKIRGTDEPQPRVNGHDARPEKDMSALADGDMEWQQ